MAERRRSVSSTSSRSTYISTTKYPNLVHLPKVKKLRVKNFYKYTREEDFQPAVQVLVGNPNLDPDAVRGHRPSWEVGPGITKDDSEEDASFIHIVRIHSRYILQLLGDFAGQSWARNRARAFPRPFEPLIHFHAQCKEALEKRDGPGPEQRSDSDTDSDIKYVSKRKRRNRRRKLENDNSEEKWEHIRCYVDFVEAELLPLYHQFDNLTSGKVRFSDLWSLFRVGELVFAPATQQPYTTNKPYQALWRLYEITPVSERATSEADAFTLHCYYVDFDGMYYGPVSASFNIHPHAGEKTISSLPVYPVRFLRDAAGTLAQHQTIGENFQRYIVEKHAYYEGWTLQCTPAGQPITSVKNHREYIHSEVIIDFIECFQVNSWRPPFEDLTSADLTPDSWQERREDPAIFYSFEEPVTGHYSTMLEDLHSRRDWEEIDRPTGERRRFYSSAYLTVMTQIGNDVCLRERNDYVAGNKFLMGPENNARDRPPAEDVCLLPPRMVAYALRSRRFIQADIRSFKDVKVREDIWDSLELPQGHKKMVISLVHEHFRKKAMQSGGDATVASQDVVRGKGAGLFFLLHGVPGVGKTATAEAVAQTNGKPLFIITCGDLGFAPSEVESSLEEIFRLAHLWDCVLLLDEADVFLSRRSPWGDLKRNALVSG